MSSTVYTAGIVVVGSVGAKEDKRLVHLVYQSLSFPTKKTVYTEIEILLFTIIHVVVTYL